MKTFLCFTILLLIDFGYNCHGYSEGEKILSTWKNFYRDDPLEFLGTDCLNSEECDEFVEGSKCLENKCDCPKSWVLSRDRTKCLEPAKEYGSKCEEDLQCSETLLSGGVCLKNECKCKEGYHYLKGICWKSQQLQQRCHRNEQCFSAYDYRGQECLDKVCTCRFGYYDRFNKSCRKKRNPGESCNVDSDCPKESTCEKMKCTGLYQIKPENDFAEENDDPVQDGPPCSRGLFLLDGKCVLELGMNCSSDSDCKHIPKASCTDGVCSCEPVLAIANESKRKCLPIARGKVQDITKSVCKEDPQCAIFGENSYCLNKKCACKNGTYWSVENQYCWTVKGLGDTCASDKDCYPEMTHATCTDNLCTCQDGYYVNNSVCWPEARKVGDHCEASKDCLFEHSMCDTTIQACKCQDRYYEDNGACKPGIGSPCDDQSQCAHLKNSKCATQGEKNKKFCLCEDGHVQADHIKYCLPVALYGEPCQETFQCQAQLGPLSICVNETCTCSENSHHYMNECYRSRGIGQTCTKKQECFIKGNINSTICLNGYCACNYDYSLFDNDCVKSDSDIKQMKSFMLIILTSVTLWNHIA